MLYRGLLADSYSGRIDGVVASHNRGTQYFRALGEPIEDPQTAIQLECRQALEDLWHNWSVDLSPEIRQLWYQYALANPVSDRIGAKHPLTGWPAYVRQNFHMQQVNVHFTHDFAPNSHPIFYANPLTFVPYPIQVLDSTKIGIVYNNTDPWSADDNNGFAIYVSPQMPPTRLSYKGPFKLIGVIYSTEENPPTPASPAEFDLGYETTPGFHIFTKINFFGSLYARQGPFMGRITITA